MENKERYKHLNEYLKNKFGERTLKICIDGGFTCPNRDGTVGTKGCIFCSERGSGEHIKCSSISKQIENYFNSIKYDIMFDCIYLFDCRFKCSLWYG